MKMLDRTPARRLAPLLALVALSCSDAAIDVLGVGSSRGDVRVDVDGPLSSIGVHRYYDGVRLLECDVQLTARAYGEVGSARWVEGVVDLVDLTTGRYLGTDYLMAPDLADFWGSGVIHGGERRTSRYLRYTSYGPFRAEFTFRYHLEDRRDYARARHYFDCR